MMCFVCKMWGGLAGQVWAAEKATRDRKRLWTSADFFFGPENQALSHVCILLYSMYWHTVCILLKSPIPNFFWVASQNILASRTGFLTCQEKDRLFGITNMGHLSGLAGHSGQHRSDKVSIILSLWPYDITILWWLPPMEVPIGTPKPRLVWKSFNSDAKISILCHFLMTTPFSRIKLSSPALFRSIP